MIWEEYKNYLNDDEKTRRLHALTGDIDTIKPPPEYARIWKDVSFEVQRRKAQRHGLNQSEMVECLVGLQKRPYYLVHMAKQFGVKNIVEVGTAQGLQFYSFAKYIKDTQNGGQVWSCDIEDCRDNEWYKEEYSAEAIYCSGTSATLGENLRTQGIEVDLFYIDADHRRNAVLQDVANLRHLQTDESLWVFDDFDLRFGCYHDIIQLCKKSGCFKIYRVGDAASGNPNHQVIIFGKL
tara:strand:- start:1036 stop:1746 length:711 start_codon:yes stop_codon:yes gene_type:complete